MDRISKKWEVTNGRKLLLKMQGKIYQSCVRSAMLYGSETWCLRENKMEILRRTEKVMMRTMSSLSFELFIVSFMQENAYIGRIALALTLGLQVFATTTGRLLGPTICLLHKDEGIPLSVLPKDKTSKLAGLFSTLSLTC